MSVLKQRIAQRVSDQGLEWIRRPPSTKGSISGSVLRRCRRWLVAHGDPLVLIDLYGRRLSAPLSHELPYYHALYPTYNKNLVDVIRSLPVEGRPPRVVDIGANIGDTAAMVLSEIEAELLCIDADPRYFELLRQNIQDQRVTAVQAAIGAAAGGRVRVERQAGTGSVRLDDTSPLQMSTLPDLLAQYPQFNAPDLVKIDTDGHDFAIIEGSSEWLASVRPALFYESDDHLAVEGTSAVSTLKLLASSGYTTATLWDKYGNVMTSIALDDAGIAVAGDLHRHAASTAGYFDILVAPRPFWPTGVRG